jgi:hypothetical protein
MNQTPPVNMATIETEARTAARDHNDVNACCPYPFQSNAGQIYRAAFQEERNWLTRGTPNTQAAS